MIISHCKMLFLIILCFADFGILQPDIAAPGVSILAAYTKFTTVTGEEGDARVVKYNIQSGTSMACPHVSGAAAYVKSFHPDWSSAAIKSALMTTCKLLSFLNRNTAYLNNKLRHFLQQKE